VTEIGELRVPQACTLPTIEQPLRLAEFHDLFSTGLTAQTRLSPTVLRWSLDPVVETVARDLTARETECCSFFRFGFASTGEKLEVEVEVPPEQVEVLNALEQRAATAMAAR
jgi:hypothetical protein